ncbi:hypothetical protein AVEN_160679-1 [Araneus ventricosus]|uniref:Uncharacterized protein n=1 Tax=Araneus ventricosus TaxID=182803 RepID=A0A4Y2JW28_ARAVE|nr:hypothetical protein AVEN_160679-1 [Araneus ventricosus]
MAQHGALQEQLSACLILSEYQRNDNYISISCVHIRRLLPRLMRRLCAMKCVIDSEIEELLAVGFAVLPSGGCGRRWNLCDLWRCHLLVELRVVVA